MSEPYKSRFRARTKAVGARFSYPYDITSIMRIIVVRTDRTVYETQYRQHSVMWK